MNTDVSKDKQSASKPSKQVLDHVAKLRETINYHRNLYHLEDREEISEAALDSLKDELVQLEQQYPGIVTSDSPTQRIAGGVLDKFEKVTHKIPQWSFNDGFNFEDLTAFVTRAHNILKKERATNTPSDMSFFCEQKIDGLKIVLEYQDGLLVRAATRGDGTVGENVTNNAKTIESIPLKLTKPLNMIVEGEVFMPKKEFKKLNAKQKKDGLELYANPRNVAAGTMRQLDSAVVASRKLACFVYDIAQSQGLGLETQADEITFLEELGFYVNTERKLCSSPQQVWDYYREQNKVKEDFDHGIDGLVVKINEIETQELLGYTGKAPRFALALKFPAEQKTTVVQEIVLQVGRTGVITPVAEFEPTQVAGTTVSRATLHNAEEIERLDVRVGDTVIIEKAGDIIPKVVEVVKTLRPGNTKPYKFPKKVLGCGGDGSIEKIPGQVAYRCVDRNSGDAFKRKLHYLVSKKALDIEGLGPRIIDQLMDQGLLHEPADIFLLRRDDVLGLEGFKDKSVDNLLAAISSRKTISFQRFIIALSIDEVGEETAILLAGLFPTLETLRSATAADLETIEGIGPVMAQNIVSWFETKTNQSMIDHLLKHITIEYPAKNKSNTSQPLTNKRVVVTGTLPTMSRDQAHDLVRDLGGRVGSAVSANTDILIAGAQAGSKKTKAQELGVPIWSEEDLQNLV